jgi:PKD repeat protein
MHRINRKLVAFFATLACAGFLFSGTFENPLPEAAASCNIFNVEDCPDYSQVNYCNSNDPNSSRYCSINKGTDIVKDGVNDIEKGSKFSNYVQRVVSYLLMFLGIVGVIYIIYSGFVVMTSAGDEEKVKKAKGTIKYVAFGLLLIFLAYSIVTFLIGKNGKGGIFNTAFLPSLIDTAYADEASDVAISGTFEEYKRKIDSLAIDLDRQYKVDGKISDATLLRLKALVIGSMDTFPDTFAQSNTTLASSLVTAIEVVRKDPSSDTKVGDLAETLSSYFKNVRIPRIDGKAAATPAVGNAPLTVSLRAEEVKDPSGVVTPRGNYVWWMKTAGGSRTVIGTGPSIAYTFREERNYTVFLDILSASRNSKRKTDVLPLQSSVDVSVLPKLGNILLYLNGTNVSLSDRHKVTPATGRAGIVLDATASQATGGAAVVKTAWMFGNGVAVTYDGPPRLERQIYAGEGVYRVKLTLTTNEKQEIIKEFDLLVQDPMATIRADKVEGYAGEDFKFQANPNMGGTALAYEWNIMESDDGKILHTSKVLSTNYKFPRPGRYVVQLKTFTPNGKQDVDTKNISINSKEPVALFDIRNTSQETPNTVLLDATKSYDPDSLEASRLTFLWNIDGERVELSDSQRAGALGKYTFSTLGTHKISLEVTNEQGKTSLMKKDTEVTSLLAVKLSATPKIAMVGQSVNFVAESKEANAFEWNFGDGENDLSSVGRVSHAYKKSGMFDVRLTIRGGGGSSQNSITKKVYVVDANTPFALITLKRESDTVSLTEAACGGNEAYVIDRVKAVRFSAEESVNVDGLATGLSYSWKYGSKTSTQRDFTYKFDETGCFPVELTVRSQKTGKLSTTRTFVKVENVLPTFSSVSITPQKADSDPVILEVTANNATDEDGAIVSYLWYYYTDSDPEPQDFRITRTNKTTFVLPRINGKYYFAVTMEDSNGDKVNSEQQREERYSITLATDNINTPIITLKANATNVAAGVAVKFDAIVKNVLQKDLSDKAQYKWDFDGDGFYDESTDSPTVSHSYSIPGTYNMKVKATYKGISNTKYQIITVKNDLRPSLEIFAIGKKFVFVNTTPGLYATVKWSLSNGVTSSNRDSFAYEFGEGEDLASAKIRMDVSDGKETKYVEASIRKDVVNRSKIEKSEDRLIYLSYPKANDGVIEVSDANDPVFLYMGESRGEIAKYSIDADISTDSDLNGETADDADNKGGESYAKGSAFALRDLSKGNRERTVKLSIFDSAGKVIESKEVKIILSYKAVETGSGSELANAPEGISDADKASIETLKDLIRTKAQEQDRMKLMQYLSLLQENWFDQREKTKVVIDFESHVSGLKIDQSAKDQIFSLLEGFLVADSQTNDEMALAVSVLKSLIPESNAHYKEIVGTKETPGLVDEILSHPTNTALNRDIGKKILEFIKDDQNIENKDKVIIKSQLEVIIYGGQSNVPAGAEEPPTESGGGIVSFILGFGKAV